MGVGKSYQGLRWVAAECHTLGVSLLESGVASHERLESRVGGKLDLRRRHKVLQCRGAGLGVIGAKERVAQPPDLLNPPWGIVSTADHASQAVVLASAAHSVRHVVAAELFVFVYQGQFFV